jgi:hypothetical protein
LQDGNILPLLAGCDRRDEEGKQTVEEWLHGNNIVKPPATVKGEGREKESRSPENCSSRFDLPH